MSDRLKKKPRRQPAVMLIWLAGLLLTASLVANAEDSPVRTAPLRLRIELAPNSTWPAPVGTVEIAPCLNLPGAFGVFTAAGKPVAFQTYWSATGEPTRIRFDTSSGAKNYFVAFGSGLPAAPGGWKPEAGVVLETRACTAQPVNTFPQISKLLATAGPVQGRNYFPDIFIGMNPFGPSSYYVASFAGWFRVANPGNYRFATVSTGASWLQIDGQTVTEWLGEHPPHGGRRGQHAGDIQLRAGLHRLDYTQVQFDGEAAAEAAWQPPGTGHFSVIPASAFTPVARFRSESCESTTAPEQLYFEIHAVTQCALDDAMALRVRFHVVDNSQPRTYRWRFDDGTEAKGASVEHFFPQPGLRSITLEAWENNRCIATNTTRLRFAPNWLQRDWWRPDIFDDAKDDFLHRDLSRMPARDLAAMLALADRADDRELLTGGGKAMVSRAAEFATPVDGAIFYKLGLGFEHQGDAGNALAEKSLRLALTPERLSPGGADKVKLRLAGLLIHWAGDFDEAEKLLASIAGNRLTGDENRWQQLLQGDLLLARGKTDAAQKQYLATGSQSDRKTTAATAAARRESASILIERNQFNDAQTALDRLLFEIPVERMALGTGLLKIKLALAQKEFQRASTGCRLLLPVAENEPRQSKLLYDTVEASLALGKVDEARQALARLLKNFPYSESAAKAKAQWPQH